MAETVRCTCSMQGENVQICTGALGLSGEMKGFESPFVVLLELSGELDLLDGGGFERVRCRRATQGAGRSRKIASALGLEPSTRNPSSQTSRWVI